MDRKKYFKDGSKLHFDNINVSSGIITSEKQMQLDPLINYPQTLSNVQFRILFYLVLLFILLLLFYNVLSKLYENNGTSLQATAAISYGIFVLSVLIAFYTHSVSKYFRIRIKKNWLEIHRFPDFKIKYDLSSVITCIINTVEGRKELKKIDLVNKKKCFIGINNSVLIFLSNGTCQIVSSKVNKEIAKRITTS